MHATDDGEHYQDSVGSRNYVAEKGSVRVRWRARQLMMSGIEIPHTEVRGTREKQLTVKVRECGNK